MGPWGHLVDNISSKQALYPPRPASYAVKHHEDAQREAYIESTDRGTPVVLSCEVAMASTAKLQKDSPNCEEIVTAFLPFKRSGQRVRPTILFSHGNAVDLGQMLPFYRYLSRNLQCNVMGYDYTGYGCSTGEPSVAATLTDIEAAYSWLLTHYHMQPQDIVLYGQSVGSGPVGHLAAKEQHLAGVIMHSPISSGIRVLRPTLKWWPSWADCYNNIKLVPLIASPMIVLHGTEDQVVDVSHGRKLHSLAKRPSQALWLEGYTHDDIESSTEYIPSLRRFLTEVFGDNAKY